MIYYLESTNSTQTFAINLIKQKLIQETTHIIAQEQTNGYGRNNNQWASPSGNFYSSIIIPENYLHHINLLPLTIALAIDKTLSISTDQIKYKWPNDILINESKVCGILVQKVQNYVICGIGINLTSSPNLQNYKTDNLQNLGLLNFKIDQKNLQLLSQNIYTNIIAIENTSTQYIIDNWLSKAYKLNKTITIKQNTQLTGIFIGINEKGHMLIKQDSKIIEIQAATSF